MPVVAGRPHDSPALSVAADAIAAGDVDTAVAALSLALADALTNDEIRTAALACAHLGDLFQNRLLNKVAARPWYERAIRLLEDVDPCIEQGWVAVAPMGCDVDDPNLLLDRAQFALGRARRFGDADLEVKSLADAGLALVELGDINEGMAMIDDALALISAGTVAQVDARSKAVCSFYAACSCTGDLERVESWTAALAACGVVTAEPGPGLFLSHHCESVRGTLLTRVGRWGEAEAVLLHAHAAIQSAMPGAAWHTPIALADLRIRQGRLDEAEALLLGKDDQIQALLPSARLHYARGDLAFACAAARRGLRLVGNDRVRAAELLEVLVESELDRGDVDAARLAFTELGRRIDNTSLPTLVGATARLHGRLLLATGDADAAVDAFRDGLAQLENADVPLTRLALHLALLRNTADADVAAARVDAKAAAALLARLDVVLDPADVALLQRFAGVEAGSPAPVPCRVASLQFVDGWWTAGCDRIHVRLRDTLGLRYIAALISRPGVELHVLDLVDQVDGVGPGIDRRSIGSAGPQSDQAARNAYRARVLQLRDDIEDALAAGRDDKAARLQTEADTVVAELAKSFGLGGRERWASSTSEKARLNVTRAIRAAVAKLTDALPEPGAALDRGIRTGAFCAYEPKPEDRLTWIVQSPVNEMDLQ